MSKLIEIETFIKQAKKRGIDFGKGDPYNRLRYYTKIGWLPHMERKQGKGHYPTWALDRLELIEQLKKKGLTNDEIEGKIQSRNKIQAILNIIKSPETRNKTITYTSFVILLIILSSELGLVSLGKPKNIIFTQSEELSPQQIIASGSSFVPNSKNSVFIKTDYIIETHNVYVTFTNNISPATRFWVSEKEPLKGFTLQLDAPVAQDAGFSWWITN